jgi:hypothetical protein
MTVPELPVNAVCHQPVGNEDRSRGLSGRADQHPAPKRRQAIWPQPVPELGSLLWPSRDSPADLSGAWSSIAAARPAAVKARTVPFPRSAHSRILLATYRRASCPSVPPGRNLHALSSAISILARIRGPKPSVSMTTPSVSDGLNYIGQIENEKKEKKNPPGRDAIHPPFELEYGDLAKLPTAAPLHDRHFSAASNFPDRCIPRSADGIERKG